MCVCARARVCLVCVRACFGTPGTPPYGHACVHAHARVCTHAWMHVHSLQVPLHTNLHMRVHVNMRMHTLKLLQMTLLV